MQAFLTRLQHRSQQTESYRWYALGVTTLCQAAAQILAYGFGPLAPFLQQTFHISRAEVGLITSATSLATAPSALFGGWAADRVSERRALILSGLVTTCAALAISLSGSFGSLLGLFAVYQVTEHVAEAVTPLPDKDGNA